MSKCIVFSGSIYNTLSGGIACTFTNNAFAKLKVSVKDKLVWVAWSHFK